MDGSRVAYASGGRIHIWNMATGATTTVKGNYSNAKHTANASQLAIAGTRVAWIKDQQFGNTEEGEKLYTASIGGKARQVMHVYRYGVDDPTHTTGGWIAGLVGSGKSLAVSTWESDGTAAIASAAQPRHQQWSAAACRRSGRDRVRRRSTAVTSPSCSPTVHGRHCGPAPVERLFVRRRRRSRSSIRQRCDEIAAQRQPSRDVLTPHAGASAATSTTRPPALCVHTWPIAELRVPD